MLFSIEAQYLLIHAMQSMDVNGDGIDDFLLFDIRATTASG
jgi:hypothetical protein